MCEIGTALPVRLPPQLAQNDNDRLADDLLALESEQQHQRRQQRDQRNRLQRCGVL
jgi:hypothetical protein